jgi:hypothetical protein
VAIDVLGEDARLVIRRRNRVFGFWIPAAQLHCRDVIELRVLLPPKLLAASGADAVLADDDPELHQDRDRLSKSRRRCEGKLSIHLLSVFAFVQKVKHKRSVDASFLMEVDGHREAQLSSRRI